jgi:nucleotide-binding universal stress UspA family protein
MATETEHATYSHRTDPKRPCRILGGRLAVLDRILVPLDGSTCADQALTYALALAKAENAQIYVSAFVDARAILGRDLSDPLEEERTAAAMAEARQIVASAVARATNEGLRSSGRADFGEPVGGIIERATETGADTIVMGTHGRSGFKRLFMGSIAERVLRCAPCPVVLIRERAVFEPPEARLSTPVCDDTAIFASRLVEVAPDDFERLYGEIATFMDGPGAAIPGLLEAELFGSIDRRRIQVLAKFRSHADWTRAQWDGRLGDLVGEILVASQTLDFDLYHGDRFPSKPPSQPIVSVTSR